MLLYFLGIKNKQTLNEVNLRTFAKIFTNKTIKR